MFGVGAGVFANLRLHRRAAVVSAGVGLSTALLSVLVHGAGLMMAFDAVANVPAEAKSRVLAEGIHQAASALSVGMGLAMACLVVSSVAWWRLRRAASDVPAS
jgi:hypothetical protein